MTRLKSNFNLEQAIGFNLNRAAHLMSEEVALRFRRQGFQLTAQDFGILYRLSRQAGLSQAEIGALMMRDKTTITRRLDGLVKKGLIERRPAPADRRVSQIHLTRAGEETVESLIGIVSDFQVEVLNDIPASDKEVTLKTIKIIIERLVAG